MQLSSVSSLRHRRRWVAAGGRWHQRVPERSSHTANGTCGGKYTAHAANCGVMSTPLYARSPRPGENKSRKRAALAITPARNVQAGKPALPAPKATMLKQQICRDALLKFVHVCAAHVCPPGGRGTEGEGEGLAGDRWARATNPYSQTCLHVLIHPAPEIYVGWQAVPWLAGQLPHTAEHTAVGREWACRAFALDLDWRTTAAADVPACK